MNARLSVTHTASFDGRPLAVVDGLPGGSADLTPAQMRALAQALVAAAADCERLPIRRGRRCTVRQYAITRPESQPGS